MDFIYKHKHTHSLEAYTYMCQNKYTASNSSVIPVFGWTLFYRENWAYTDKNAAVVTTAILLQ